MASTQGSGVAFSTDPHLNASIDEVLSGFADESANGADSSPTQDGSQVESPREIPTPTPGDSGHAVDPSPDAPTAPSPVSVDGKPPTPAADDLEPPTEPFSYTVDGQPKTIAEFVRIPGEGVFVPEAHVPRFQEIATRAEANDTALRAIADERQAERQTWERLTAWNTRTQQGVKPDGSPNYVDRTLTGRDAVEASRVALSTATAKVMAYEKAIDALTDPQKFQAYFQAVQGDDGQTYILPNHQALAEIKREAGISAREFALLTRQHMASISAPASPSAPSAPAETPVSQLATPTIEALASTHQVAGLTAADKQFLAAQFDRYVVMTDTGRAVDPRFLDVMKDRAQFRAEQSKLTSTSDVVNRFNRGQDKGRAGQRPVAPVAAAPIPQPPADSRKRRSRNERTGPTWDEILQRGMADPDVQNALQGTG